MNSLTLNNRNHLEVTGIKKVKSSEPSSIVAVIQDGHLLISGTNLSVEQLDIKAETLVVNGMVNSIKYSNQVSKSFSLKNMFK